MKKEKANREWIPIVIPEGAVLTPIPEVDDLLRHLADEQVVTLLKKSADELGDPSVRKDSDRETELFATCTACSREGVRRGGRILEEMVKERFWANSVWET